MTMTDLQEKYADKIAKLLAKAESTTPQEAELLMAKAQESFLEGMAVPDTLQLGGDNTSLALAGFLQGLAIGYEYAKRVQL